MVALLDGKEFYRTTVGGERDQKAIDQTQEAAVDAINARLRNIRFQAPAGQHTIAVTFIKRANIESEERFPSTPPEGGEVRQAFLSALQIRGPLKITDANLHEYVAGAVIVNDYSARDVQIPQMQFYKGKSFRTFGPVGPWLTLLDTRDIGALKQLQLKLTVNGQPVAMAKVKGSIVTFDHVELDKQSSANTIKVELETSNADSCVAEYPSPIFVDCDGPDCSITQPVPFEFIGPDDEHTLFLNRSMSNAGGDGFGVQVTTDAALAGHPVELIVDGAL